jgi:hypothetical protein
MEQPPDEKPGGFETSSVLRRVEAPTTLPPEPAPAATRSNSRVWAAVLAVLVVGLLAYLLFALL